MSILRSESVVVMPAANRPEFAALALLFLKHASDCPTVHLYVDDVNQKLKDEFNWVWENYGQGFDCKMIFREPHREATSGCWNILESIKNGYETGAKYVALVEEDVFVRENFFHAHWYTLETEPYEISCGRKCPRFWRTHPNVYTNPGSVLSRRFLDKLIPHINDKFYDNTGEYIKNLRPDKPGFIGGLDDGLIRRIIDIEGFNVHHQDPSVCSHVGFQAYENRYDFCQINLDLPIAERVEQLKKMFIRLDPISGPHKMHLRDLDPLSNEQAMILSTN